MPNSNPYHLLGERALAGEAPSIDEAHWILDAKEVELLSLLQAALRPREKHFGRQVKVHVLNNIQNGLCEEDCGYCSQSKGSEAAIRQYPIKSDEDILVEAEKAACSGASRYCMVASGREPTVRRTRKLASLVREIKSRHSIEVCVSVGSIDDERAAILAEAGLDRLNHNLNTSEDHYGDICSTHTYADRIATLEAAKRHRIATCSGLIAGMGERSEDLIDIAFRLRELEVPSIPVNFLIPIEGNRVQQDDSLTPERCLRVLCLMRFVSPSAEIRVAGGREGHLRTMQSLSLYPANSLFVEGYLTTMGDVARETYRMIEDAGFEVEGNAEYRASQAGNGSSEEKQGFELPGRGGALLKPEIER